MSGMYRGRRKTLTNSIFPTASSAASSVGEAFSPSELTICGLTGMIRYPRLCMKRETPRLARPSLLVKPTTAMVLALSRISRIVVGSFIVSIDNLLSITRGHPQHPQLQVLHHSASLTDSHG